MVSKFTDKDLQKLEAEAELRIYQDFQSQNSQLGLPLLNKEQEKQILLGNERCSPLIWNFFEKAGPTAKQRLFNQVVFNAILGESEIDRYELVCNNLEVFLASQAEQGQKENMAYRNFQYYKEISVQAMKFFYQHFARTDYLGFSTDAYQQWFASLRLGIYSAPEKVLSGSGSLNYPDLRPQTRQSMSRYEEYSPRLDALKEYLQTIYQLRVKVQLLDLLIRNLHHAGNSPNVSLGQWEKFVNSTRQQLLNKFGSEKGQQLFKKLFGSDKPNAPANQSDFSHVQQAVLESITYEILREQSGDIPCEPEPTPSGFHRDYAKEQAEREKREKENRERKARENKNWANINPAFNNNPNLVKQWTDKGFTYETAKEWMDIGLKPTDSEFTAYLAQEKKLTPEEVLNTGDINQLKQEFQAWKNQPKPQPKPEEQKREKSPSRQAAEDKNNGKEVPPPVETSFNDSKLNEDINKLNGANQPKKPDQDLPYTPSPGLGMPLNSIMKEDALKLPWLVMNFNLEQSGRFPCWNVYDPANLAVIHGSGDSITLLCRLLSVNIESDYSNVLHNIFKMKNPDKKGFELFNEPEPVETQQLKLLIAGKRENDKRADELGWNAWPFLTEQARSETIPIGIPNVKQKSWRFTRWMRTNDKAYDLDDTNHFIGILKAKGLFGGFQNFGAGRIAGWGNAPKTSILWITNQIKYPHKENQDWGNDDTKTINPDNGFAHYLIFSNLSTEQINSKFINNPLPALNCKTLPELVGKITKEGKGVMVRLGPDALELINSQSPQQKGRSDNETPQNRNNNQSEVKEPDLPELGISKEQFDALNTPFTDSAKVANIIKQLANTNNPSKMAEMLNRMFEHLQPQTRERKHV